MNTTKWDSNLAMVGLVLGTILLISAGSFVIGLTFLKPTL
jgi:hypothetical protein